MTSHFPNPTFIFIAATLVTVAGCSRDIAVWIAPGSTASHLVFMISDKRGSSKPIKRVVLRVDPCDSIDVNPHPPLWGFYTQAPVHEVVYGEMPEGASRLVNQPEQTVPLTAGCYQVGGAGTLVFDVLPDGSVIERVVHRQRAANTSLKLVSATK
jgi:hypothetical protein